MQNTWKFRRILISLGISDKYEEITKKNCGKKNLIVDLIVCNHFAFILYKKNLFFNNNKSK